MLQSVHIKDSEFQSGLNTNDWYLSPTMAALNLEWVYRKFRLSVLSAMTQDAGTMLRFFIGVARMKKQITVQ